ncbi:MAG: GNAT family N-acetyltransferase [Oscillospiraceae bacterium]|nr:GNAT family N-acetyltransferase [Oscillospiraceae bacterium]
MTNMTNQEIAQKLMETDNHYYKSFANFKNTDYGILYYKTDDPTWTDFNHASIINYDRDSNFDAILQDIKNFYISKNLKPFVYSDFIPGQREIMQDSLIKNGFTIEDNYGGQTYVIHTSECKIDAPYTLKFERVEKGANLSCIYEIISEDDKEDADDIVNIKIKLPDFNLFVGYLNDGTPVTMADLEYYDGVVLLDDVETAKKYRGKGYARQMIRFLVDYHYKNYNDSLFYLYYDNPVAGRIYKEAGFTKADIEMWGAFYE